ncbi:MAG: LysR family transcriptional regulator [Bacteroidetes bacterium]|nr:LysR family transcriptional regulator [Bacteroidota bacterium]
MTITQLEYVVAVDRYSSFAEAAGHCFVTQPTLSIQIRKLEEKLGVVLFDRNRKPVLTTDIGRQIVQQARAIIREAKRMAEVIDEHRQEMSGELRVGIIPTLSPYLLPRFAGGFIEHYPRVELVVQEQTSQSILDQLRNDELDVGIMVAPEEMGPFTALPMFREEFLLYLSSQHSLCRLRDVELSKLDTTDMWLLQDGHCFRDQIETLCGDRMDRAHGPAPLRFQSASLETIRKMVEMEHGYTLLPELAVLDLSSQQQKNVRRFRRARPVREISLILHRHYVKKRLVEALRATIVASVPAEMRSMKRGTVVPWSTERQ